MEFFLGTFKLEKSDLWMWKVLVFESFADKKIVLEKNSSWIEINCNKEFYWDRNVHTRREEQRKERKPHGEHGEDGDGKGRIRENRRRQE